MSSIYRKTTPPFATTSTLRDSQPGDLLAAAVRGMTDGVAVFEIRPDMPDPEVIYANDSFTELTGYYHRHLARTPLRLSHLHGPRTSTETLEKLLDAFRDGTPFTGDLALYQRDGGMFFCGLTLNVLARDPTGTSHYVAIIRDLTEIRRLQEALLQSTKLEAVGQLAGGVAHDFNNLLSVINGYCEMLAARFRSADPAMREIKEIHKAGMKAAALTRQLLAFSRRQVMDPRIINLNQVIREVLEMLRHLVGSAVRLEVRLTPNLANVRADPVQIQQVLLNLVINARDAMPRGGRVVIRTRNRTIKPGRRKHDVDVVPGIYATIAVADTGEGMDEATLEHLFEPFFTTKDLGRGTGLGLSTAYGIVKQSGGIIMPRTRLGKGSTFEVFLPAVLERAEPFETGMSLRSSTRGAETILLVEDDEVVRKMIAGILSADGYRVLNARTVDEAISISSENPEPIHLMVADLTMPLRNGPALAAELRRKRPELKVLFMSGLAPDESIHGKFGPGTGFVQKPFALNALMKKLRDLLDESNSA